MMRASKLSRRRAAARATPKDELVARIVEASIRWKWHMIDKDRDWSADTFETALADAVTDYELTMPVPAARPCSTRRR